MSNHEKDQLVRELHDRSHDVGGHPIAFDSVKQSARKIQRRRGWVGGVVAAMVGAVAIPTGLALSTNLTTAEGPVDTPSVAGSPSGDASESAAPKPDGPVRLTLNGLERGDNPRIDYIAGQELMAADGTVTSLDGAYSRITPYFPGWLAGAWTETGFEQVFLDEAGNTLRSQAGSTFAVNASGTEIAYVTAEENVQDGPRLVFAPTNGAESAKVRLPVEADARPVGFLDEFTVVYGTDGQRPETFVTSFQGGPQKVPGLTAALDASESGLIAGATKITDFGSCSAVVRADGFDELWETCDFSLLTFSPDGRYVMGTGPYQDGIGDTELSIIDVQTGEVTAHYKKQDMGSLHINDMVWEDDTHALATVYEDGEWAVVRVDTEGRMEAATDLFPGSSEECPFFFSAQP